jgi:hypothetical protein
MKRLSPAFIIFLILVPAIITDITRVRSWTDTINADGYGYYAYLPCTFIYHSLDYKKIMEEEHKLRPGMDMDEVAYPFVLYNNDNTKLTDKYFVGVSVVLTPFFLLAFFLSYVFGFSLTGYSALFQEAVVVAALFYLFLGLYYLRKLLLEYKVPDRIIYFTLALVLYGTNLFYYATVEPSISHVYSFGLVAVFLYYAKQSINDTKLKNLLPAILLLGLLCVIRPTNLFIVLVIPFLAGSFQQTKLFVIRTFNLRNIIVLLGAITLVLSIQLFKWHAETGQWYIWGYGGESFDFSKPHFTDTLFSYRKGWFLYTPLMLFTLIGSVPMLARKRNYFLLAILVLFFIITTYVFSSWWQWWYGGSFGMRVFVDFYAFYALLLAWVLTESKGTWTRRVMIAVPVLCLGLCIIQTIQYNKFIISYDKMNKKKYWDIFLKTADRYGWVYDNPASKLVLFNSPMLFAGNKNANSSSAVSKAHLHSGAHQVQVTPSAGQVTLFAFKASEIPDSAGETMFVTAWANMPDVNCDAAITTHIVSANGTISYTDTHSLADEIAGNEWERIQYFGKPLPLINASDSIKVYVKCITGSVLLDDVSIQFGKQRQD